MTYIPPTIDQLKELFGEQLKELNIAETVSDVDDFVTALEKAMAETKKHSIQFGQGTTAPRCSRCRGEGRYYASYENMMDHKLSRCPDCNLLKEDTL
jgi:hypothetical protein